MPLVRINLSKSYSPEQRQIVSDVVYTAMIEIANVPAHDKFQIFAPHSDGVSEGWISWHRLHAENHFHSGVLGRGPDHGRQEGVLSQNRGGSKRQAWDSEARCLDHSG
jgi:Tautomerase enzyme